MVWTKGRDGEAMACDIYCALCGARTDKYHPDLPADLNDRMPCPCTAADSAAKRNPSYVTVTHGIRGYFAVLLVWVQYDDIPQGFYEPENSGVGSYRTAQEAIPEALEWAKDEGIELRLAGYNSKGEPVS